MPSAEHQVVIWRPVADVFAFVADGLNGPKWRPDVLAVALVSGTGAGAVYRLRLKGVGSRWIDADYKITVYEPDRRLAFETIAGPVRPTGEFQFDAVNNGTRVIFSVRAEVSLLNKLLTGRGSVQKRLDAEVASIERLRQALEVGRRR